MPSRPTKRLLWFVTYLSRHRAGVTRAEMDISWRNSGLGDGDEGLHRSTFNRLKAAALEVFNIDIVVDKSTDRWSIAYDGDIKDNRFLTWLIDSFSILGLANKNQKLQDHMVFETISEGKVHLDTMAQAILDRKTVEFDNDILNDGKLYKVELQPYFLRLYNRRWYVYGKISDESYKSLKDSSDRLVSGELKSNIALLPTDNSRLWVFSLDDTVNPKPTNNNYEIPVNFNPKSITDDTVGIDLYNGRIDDDGSATVTQIDRFGGHTMKILLKARLSAADSLSHTPLHKSQRLIMESNNEDVLDSYKVFEYDLHPTPDFYKILLRYGTTVEVICPESVRNKMRDLANILVEMYQKE